MAAVNLMDLYPQTKRPISERAAHVTDADRAIAREFGRDYFDGSRMHGYGGYYYHPRFWTQTVKRFRDHYDLQEDSRILDVGCAKGFMLHDFSLLLPKAKLAGIDISSYAIDQAIESVKPFLQVGNAASLPYADNSFDLVIGINVVHNLDLDDCKKAIREIQRVTRRHAFIQIDAYETEEERKALLDWIVTCRTHMYKHQWRHVFDECGYTGDYWWFVAQ